MELMIQGPEERQMKAEHIKKLIDPKQKFHPFTIRTGSGSGYRVISRENMWMPGEGELVLVYEPGQGVTMIDTDEITECQREIKKREAKAGDL
jgi:hypothetical protein